MATKYPHFVMFLVMALLIPSNYCFASSSTYSCIPEETTALLDFKQGLVDNRNRLSTWVATDEDCCTWSGITCNNLTGNVVELDLRNTYDGNDGNWSLAGELRSSLLVLKHLKYLDLSYNNFGGINIPPFLGSFNHLQYLNLSGAGFGGGLPHQLGNLTKLQYLDLNIFTSTVAHLSPVDDSVQWISNLSSLKYLDLSGIRFVNGLQLIQTLNMIPSIIEVHLQYCGINNTDLSIPQVNFTTLSVLDLSANSMNSIPTWFFNLSSLTYLDLSDNQIQGNIPTTIENLALLKFLGLSSNNFEPGDVILTASLGKLCHLESLTFASINISRDLAELEEVFSGCIKNSLKSLDLDNTGVKGQLPDWLWDIKELASISLSGNSILGFIPASIGRLRSLQQFSLANNQLIGTIPESLGELYSLQRLDLSKNMLRGTITEGLGKLSELIYLDLSYNQLNGTLTEAHFSNLISLKHLSLSRNSLRLKIESDWLPPFRLELIDLEYCSLGPHFPAWLKMQENLAFVNIASTGIVDSLPEWFWSSFPNVGYIDMSDNQIGGRLPHLTHLKSLAILNLYSNCFIGSLPDFPFGLNFLDLSNNNFSGAIP